MKSQNNLAQRYFDKVPRQWDSLYSHENPLKYAMNRLLRKGLFDRYRLTFEHCANLVGARVLDVGCGTGQFSIECAKRGAQKVVGIDFAPSMIEFCHNIAGQMGVSDKCEFICDDFVSHRFDSSFDVVLALGLFDYIKDAEPLFKKIAQLKPRKFIASFPAYTLIWGIQRKIRYEWIRKCPIYYYTLEQLERLYRSALFEHFNIIKGKHGFLGIAETKQE
jgi:ubiquinone/menaquinone biosynthesis C-methylase UbiE